MLANNSDNIQSGRLEPNIHLKFTAKAELMSFIAQEIPKWRDRPDRPVSENEPILTEHLCNYLNTTTYYSDVWDHIQFQTETTDETDKRRKIDITAKPRAAIIFIENRRHTIFDSLFPIECKRLPTPTENRRDEREYVTNEPGKGGGIQRFKFGYHGASHNFGAMIGYVQSQSCTYWLEKINGWIGDLSKNPGSEWSISDTLQEGSEDIVARLRTLNSRHQRTGGLGEITLRHVWISMN